MIKHIFPLVVAACVAPCLAAGGWIVDDMEAAKKQAAEQKKGILIEFTGSDWCPPCIALRNEVLNTPEFIEEVGKHYVLVELDFPQQRTQTEAVKAANQKLSQAYGIIGYPTLVFTDGAGLPMDGAVGGRPKEAVLAMMDRAMKRQTRIHAAQAKLAAAKTDDEKIAALGEIMKNAPADFVDSAYADYKKQLLDMDKEDKSGYRAAQARKLEVQKQTQTVVAHMRNHRAAIKTPEDALKLIREYPDRDKLLTETQQQLLLMECQMLQRNPENYDAVLKILDKVISMGEDTDFGQMAIEGKKFIADKKAKPNK